jgi:hypothetical protein
MKFELDTHPGLIIENPEVILVSTLDLPVEQKFQPSVIFIVEPNINIFHQLPMFDYVDGSWDDEDVQAAINSYLNSIDLDSNTLDL